MTSGTRVRPSIKLPRYPRGESILLTKLEALADRHQEVEALLGDAEVINDQHRFRELSVEFAHLNDVVAQYQRWQQLQGELEEPNNCLMTRMRKSKPSPPRRSQWPRPR